MAGAICIEHKRLIGVDDVKAVLNPIWKDKMETASRVRQQIEVVSVVHFYTAIYIYLLPDCFFFLPLLYLLLSD
ncbi:hypothetical protein RBH92_09265 [Nitrosomonas sp. sh817]|nr:hypothetical protein RBH92_09265 [Nitrosomonas sp. sh817]